MSHQNCCCELLVSNEMGHVALCQGCGQVHLTLQCLTVRFEAAAFRALTTMLGQAQNRIDCSAAKKAATIPLAPSDSLH